jgi:hypothetical protein
MRTIISRLLIAGALVVTATGTEVGTANANGQILAITFHGTTTSTCPLGRMCINLKTVNSCGTVTGNNCSIYNAPGDAQDFAFANDTSVWSSVYSNGERLLNRNSGTLRPFCGYKGTFLAYPAAVAFYGGGWSAAPFTGVKSIGAVVYPNGLC